MNQRAKLKVSKQHLEETLRYLRAAGMNQKECVVLWVGKRLGEIEQVTGVVCPEQEAEDDWFQIPEISLKALFQQIQMKGLVVLAQVHSHPAEAFHSIADDRLALVRKRGALSIVVPYFGKATDIENFFYNAATFSLVELYSWEEIRRSEIFNRVEAY